MNERIMETSLEALQCRLAARDAGLIRDDHLDMFYHHPCSKEPLINKGTAVRVRCIDRFLRECPDNIQVINLGAGFDTRAFHFKNLTFFEIDFERIIERKLQCMHDMPENLVLISGDLNDFKNSIYPKLVQSGLNPDYPIVILAECCFMYCTPECIYNILDALIEYPKMEIIAFDAVMLDDAFGKRMHDNLALPLPTFQSCKTVDDYARLFDLNAFHIITLCTMNEATSLLLTEEEKRLIDERCRLDEIEEWLLVSSHYVFIKLVKSR